MLEIIDNLRALYRFPGYAPQPVTLKTLNAWVRQFPPHDRKHVKALLGKIHYFSDTRIKNILVEQNRVLMARLAAAGLPPENLIYVQVDEAGSSSPVMLNILRDAANLERRGCKFLDSRDTLNLVGLTNQLGQCALIYVDDFLGTGTQFCAARDFVAKNIVVPASEFLLVPVICEEGIYQLGKRGIEAFAGHVHSKAERPLHENSTLLDPETKARLIDICKGIDPHNALGFGDAAVMVVFSRNAPDNVPVIFRGSDAQHPFVGIFPRISDLPLID